MIVLLLLAACSPAPGPYDWLWYGQGGLTVTLRAPERPELDATLLTPGLDRATLDAFETSSSGDTSPFTDYSDAHPVMAVADAGGFGAAMGFSERTPDDEGWLLAWADTAGTAWAETPCGAPVTGLAFELRPPMGWGLALISLGEGVGEPGAAAGTTADDPFVPSVWNGGIALGRVSVDGQGYACDAPVEVDVTMTWAFADDPAQERREGGWS